MLQGTYFVQIEESFDASKPFKERYTDVHNPGRVLKLQLSDGKPPATFLCFAVTEPIYKIETSSLSNYIKALFFHLNPTLINNFFYVCFPSICR